MPMFVGIIFLAVLSYFSLNGALHNDSGLLINHIFHIPRRGATVLYSLFALACSAGLLLLIALFYANITTKKEIFVFDSRISLPKSAFSKDMVTIQYDHILSLKIKTLNEQRSLLIEHRKGTTEIAESMLENKGVFERLVRSLSSYANV